MKDAICHKLLTVTDVGSKLSKIYKAKVKEMVNIKASITHFMHQCNLDRSPM